MHFVGGDSCDAFVDWVHAHTIDWNVAFIKIVRSLPKGRAEKDGGIQRIALNAGNANTKEASHAL